MNLEIKSKLQSLLTAANAKTGESDATLTDAVQTLVDGYGQGGGGEWTTDGLANGNEPSGNITINSTTLINSAFLNRPYIRAVLLANYVGKTGALLSRDVFRESGITQFRGEKNVSVGQYWFYNCTSLVSAVMPKCYYIEYGAFQGASNLEVVDCNASSGIVRGSVFSNCKKLQTLILRSSTLATLGNVANFQSTPFAGKGNAGLTGTLYVPNSLVESYKTASNWSTFYDGGTMAVLPIEGSIYETQYADGTPIPTE